MAVKHRKCRVVYKGEHLAILYYSPEDGWRVEQQDVHVPSELLPVAQHFEPYVGRRPPPLLIGRLPDPRRADFGQFLRTYGVDADDYIGQLLAMGGRATDSIRFVS